MSVEKAAAEQAKFDRMSIYFEFEAQQEYLRVQAAIKQRIEIAEQKTQEAEKKTQEAEQKIQEAEKKIQEARKKTQEEEEKIKEAERITAKALVEIERLKALLATR